LTDAVVNSKVSDAIFPSVETSERGWPSNMIIRRREQPPADNK